MPRPERERGRNIQLECYALAHARASAKILFPPRHLIGYNKHMHERDIFDERQETKSASFSCPHCRERSDYDIRWMKRTKKKQGPRQMNEQERAQYAKSRDYMVRMDDMLMCKNMRCRKRFEVPSSQSVVFI